MKGRLSRVEMQRPVQPMDSFLSASHAHHQAKPPASTGLAPVPLRRMLNGVASAFCAVLQLRYGGGIVGCP
jgi:hypothetical protein